MCHGCLLDRARNGWYRLMYVAPERFESRSFVERMKGIRIEGADQGDWVLIDGGDIVVHLFRPEVRALYGLEKMWADSWDEPTAAQA